MRHEHEHEAVKTRRREKLNAIRTADLHLAGYAGLGLNGCTPSEYISVSSFRAMQADAQPRPLDALKELSDSFARRIKIGRIIGLKICGMRSGWRQSGLARPPSDGRIPSAWRGDEIGKHSGLKIRRLTACRFKSGPRYQRPNHLIKALDSQTEIRRSRCVFFRDSRIRAAFHCVSVQPRSWGYCAPSRISHAGRSHFVNETRAA